MALHYLRLVLPPSRHPTVALVLGKTPIERADHLPHISVSDRHIELITTFARSESCLGPVRHSELGLAVRNTAFSPPAMTSSWPAAKAT